MLLGINGSGKTSLINSLTMLYEGVCGVGMSEYIRKNGSFNAILNALGDEKPECFSLSFLFDSKSLKEKFPRSPFTSDVRYTVTVFPVGNGSGFTLSESLYSIDERRKNGGFTYLEFRNGVGFITKRSDDGKVVRENYEAGVLSTQELALRQITDPQDYLPTYIIREAIASMSIYGKFNIDSVRKGSESDLGIRLSTTGDNIAYLFNRLQNNHSLVFNKIGRELNTINPNYLGLVFSYFGNRFYLHLTERNLNRTIDMLHISDGTIKLMLLMAILYNPDRGSLCGIDEPESYLHPDMIRSVVRMIKDASRQTQLVIATHSPLLLNGFKLRDILVFQKDAENDTIVRRGDETYVGEDPETVLPGQLWLNGEIGGTRW
ncbi:MAG: AAA family ATPase [Clostridium sp.]|nr:AAA family ATPase [Clostridium sp.]